jgi:hypothetical protein
MDPSAFEPEPEQSFALIHARQRSAMAAIMSG